MASASRQNVDDNACLYGEVREYVHVARQKRACEAFRESERRENTSQSHADIVAM